MTTKTPHAQWRPHPWHGLDVGEDPPRVVCAYIEITPFDLVKYEVDKRTGYLRVDRPQRTSASPPTLYGFIPRTYCASRVAALSPTSIRGDGDPLDICVVSERPIAKAEVIVRLATIADRVGRARVETAGRIADREDKNPLPQWLSDSQRATVDVIDSCPLPVSVRSRCI